ncbi:MAG: prolyl oligopeptidase family serine peptidase [Tissierella sp.]|uniref:prolyl oligopeptidase family serine peptidase n=1 Tax=Tissierella sp. TaxID=41274 RepID=UPI003F98CA3C
MLESNFIKRENHKIGDIPVIRLLPKYTEKPYKTIVFYHGWSSSKEIQLMRGMILASFGYQVILPDSINHGERGIVDYENPKEVIKYFWPTILKNLDEYKEIRDYMVKNFNADEKKIGVSGNSMGGFSAGGIFTYNNEIKALSILNGSANWKGANFIFKELVQGELPDWLKEEEEKINLVDPMNNLEKLIDRPILMLHGGADSVVDIRSQKDFYKTAYLKYRDKNKIHLIEYNNLNHIVSTNMLEETVKWFNFFI